MNNYEIMFIVKSTLEEAELKKVVKEAENLLSANDSKIQELKEMGRKKLAYPIKKEISGFYFLVNVKATKETISEFDRKFRINENVLRHLILKKEGE